MTKSFKDLKARLDAAPKKKVSVAVAQDSEVLLAVKGVPFFRFRNIDHIIRCTVYFFPFQLDGMILYHALF